MHFSNCKHITTAFKSTACLTAVLAVSAVIEIKHISQSIQEQQEGKALSIKDNHQ